MESVHRPSDMTVRNPNRALEICGLPPGEYGVRADGRIDGRRMIGDAKIRVGKEDLNDIKITPNHRHRFVRTLKLKTARRSTRRQVIL